MCDQMQPIDSLDSRTDWHRPAGQSSSRMSSSQHVAAHTAGLAKECQPSPQLQALVRSTEIISPTSSLLHETRSRGNNVITFGRFPPPLPQGSPRSRAQETFVMQQTEPVSGGIPRQRPPPPQSQPQDGPGLQQQKQQPQLQQCQSQISGVEQLLKLPQPLQAAQPTQGTGLTQQQVQECNPGPPKRQQKFVSTRDLHCEAPTRYTAVSLTLRPLSQKPPMPTVDTPMTAAPVQRHSVHTLTDTSLSCGSTAASLQQVPDCSTADGGLGAAPTGGATIPFYMKDRTAGVLGESNKGLVVKMMLLTTGFEFF